MNTNGTFTSANSSVKAYRLIVVATFTAEPIEDALAYWMEELGVAGTVEFAPYNQVLQQLLDPGSQLGQNRNGCNVVLVRIEDWQRFNTQPPGAESIPGGLEQYAIDLIGAVRTALARSSTPLVLAFCPVSARTVGKPLARDEIARIEDQIKSALAGTAGLYMVECGELETGPVSLYDDPERDHLGHIPYTPRFFAVLATVLARRIHASCKPSPQGHRSGLRQYALAGRRW